MNFTEFQFWPRLLICLAIISAIRFFLPKAGKTISLFDRISLGVLSLYLLSCVSMLTFGIFVSVFLTAWIFVHLLFRFPPGKRNRVLWIGIPLLSLPLVYYKYPACSSQRTSSDSPISPSCKSRFQPASRSIYVSQMIAMLVVHPG